MQHKGDPFCLAAHNGMHAFIVHFIWVEIKNSDSAPLELPSHDNGLLREGASQLP